MYTKIKGICVKMMDIQQKTINFWLLDLKIASSETELKTENFTNRNYCITAK